MPNPEAAGRLTLVGIGPGGLDYLTRRAERAIRKLTSLWDIAFTLSF